MKLLIVDDSNIMKRAIEKYISEKGLEIIGFASNGEEALQLFELHKPDLVTLDITMPKMDGLTALERMLSLKPSTLILVISALKDPATGIQALKKGAKGFLPKPFTKEQLLEELDSIIGGHHARG